MSREPNRNVYVGHRYVPKIMGEWDNSIKYEGLSIVLYQGASYTSKSYVPVGIDINNEEFWAITGNYNLQVEHYRQEVQSFDNRITDNTDNITGHDSRITVNENDIKDHNTRINTNKNSNADTQKELDDYINITDIDLKRKVNKGELLYNVKDFGAVGDGVNDDTIAIQDTIDNVSNDGGGIVKLPLGTYKCNIIIKDNVEIISDIGTKLIPNNNGVVVEMTGNNTILRNTEISGTEINDDKIGFASYAIRVTGQHILIDNVMSYGARFDSLYFRDGANDVKVINSRFLPTGRNSVSFVNCHDIIMENCYIHNDNSIQGEYNGLYLFDIEPNEGVQVYNITTVNCTFNSELSVGYSGYMIMNNGSPYDNNLNIFIDTCKFLNNACIRMNQNGTHELMGIHIKDSIFEYHAMEATETVTFRQGSFINNTVLHPDRFAYGVIMDDVLFRGNKAKNENGIIATVKTDINKKYLNEDLREHQTIIKDKAPDIKHDSDNHMIETNKITVKNKGKNLSNILEMRMLPLSLSEQTEVLELGQRGSYKITIGSMASGALGGGLYEFYVSTSRDNAYVSEINQLIHYELFGLNIEMSGSPARKLIVSPITDIIDYFVKVEYTGNQNTMGINWLI